MKVILRQDVDRVGSLGDVKEVKRGFARNYLLPRSLAEEATPAALAELGRRKDALMAKRAKAVEAATALSKKVDGTALSFTRPAGPEGHLFGSVGKTDIAESLKASGFEIDRAAVQLEAPIKMVGDVEVEIRLRPGVSAKVKVSVVARA